MCGGLLVLKQDTQHEIQGQSLKETVAHSLKREGQGAIATTRATEKGNHIAKAVSNDGRRDTSQQSKVASARQVRRMAKVYFRVFIIRGCLRLL